MKETALISLTLLILSQPSFSEDIKIGAEDSWPPYSDRHGQGVSTNLVNAALAKVGMHAHIEVRPYARVLQDVKAGSLDAGYNVTRQQTNEQEFVFGKEPLLQARAYWYFPAGSTTNFNSLKEIPNDFRLGCIIDYEYGDDYEHERRRFKEIRVPRQVQLIKMLQQGRISAALMFEAEANQTLKDMGLPPDTIRRGMLNHTSDIYLAFSRKNPQSVTNANKFDEGLRALKASGEYKQLLNATP